jgi:hypothetical protein
MSILKTTRHNSHCVIFRTGGTENFHWYRTLATSHENACVVRHDLRNAGFRAHVERYDLSLSIGLPETYQLA